MGKKWSKIETEKLIELRESGETIKNIGFQLNRTEYCIQIKLRRLGKTRKIEWSENDFNYAIKLLYDGLNFLEISKIIGKSHISVCSKLNRMGYKSSYNGGSNKGQTKYHNYDWNLIQNEYDNGLSYNEIRFKFNLSTRALTWAKINNKINLRTNSEGLKLAWLKGKFKQSSKSGIIRYRQLCEFKFNLADYPNEFNFKLIEEYGWYKAKNRGNNPNGINRDHIYSIKDGFYNNVDPNIISHPANCQLITHNDNIKKKSKSNITLDELKLKIENWNNKYL